MTLTNSGQLPHLKLAFLLFVLTVGLTPTMKAQSTAQSRTQTTKDFSSVAKNPAAAVVSQPSAAEGLSPEQRTRMINRARKPRIGAGISHAAVPRPVPAVTCWDSCGDGFVDESKAPRVPAIEVKDGLSGITACAEGQKSDTVFGALYCLAPRTTCADKSRVLLRAEDGTKMCVKF